MITSSDLYAMGMESETAYQHMQELCELVGVVYPPSLTSTRTAKREAMPDPLNEFLKGTQPPVMAEFQ